MLLFEQVRNLKNEQNLVSDSDIHKYKDVAHDWTTRVSKTITLTESKVVLLRYTAFIGNESGTAYYIHGNVRVLVGGVIISAMGYKGKDASNWEEEYPREAYIYLPAGTHTFDFQTSIVNTEHAAYCYVGFKDINIGIIDFDDFATINDDGDSGDVSVDDGVTATVKSISLTVPSTRKTCVGSISKIPILIFCAVACEGYAGSKLKNPGETDDSCLNWKLFVDGSQVSWANRVNDYQTIDNTKGEGAYGYYEVIVDPGASHTIELKVYNNSGAARTVRARLLAVACPWILPQNDFQPLTLDFPQGSTLYVTLEPLSRNETKNLKIGKKRAASFGDSTDYYYTASGTDILSANYTFETVEVSEVILTVNGLGGCISVIGVDIR